MTTAIPHLPPNSTANEWFNVADLLHDLGDVDAARVRMNPRPGTVTFEELIRANEYRNGPVCEWVDGTLVEKPMGFSESIIAAIILGEFDRYLLANPIGIVAGPDGVMKILPGIGRAPDVSFLRWESLPGGKPPPRSDKVPAIVPDLVVEVLSESNRPKEVERKRSEYFRAGVKLVWEIDPETRGAKAYCNLTDMTEVQPNGTLDAGPLLPGFKVSLQAVFDRAERRTS